ncbi:MAG TPA: peptidyl-prolyl cis-trans isomerase [Verrucomicrobiota bacterium]|nr:peptidyl-prolyl cis-trans isomerase [Verrucomicrobiota bacterium]
MVIRFKIIIGIVAVIVGIISARAQMQYLNGIAAIVNESLITVQEVKEFIEPTLNVIERTYWDRPQILQVKRQEILEDGINQLVERQLILSDFKNSGGSLPESIIDEEINREIREQFGDRSTLIKTLQARGITFETYRQRMRERIIISSLRSMRISQEIIISPFKIEAYYTTNKNKFLVEERVKLRIIQIKNSPSDPARAKNLAREIYEKIKSGTPFNEMTVYHEGSQKNGEWGWVEYSVLRKELADAVRKLKPGEFSDVVETSEGCWILFVEDYQPPHVKPLAEVRDEIEKELLAQERDRLQKKWVDRLKSKSFVRYF